MEQWRVKDGIREGKEGQKGDGHKGRENEKQGGNAKEE